MFCIIGEVVDFDGKTIMTALDRPAIEVIAENVDFESYLRDYAGLHMEWVDRKVLFMSPSMEEHNL